MIVYIKIFTYQSSQIKTDFTPNKTNYQLDFSILSATKKSKEISNSLYYMY